MFTFAGFTVSGRRVNIAVMGEAEGARSLLMEELRELRLRVARLEAEAAECRSRLASRYEETLRLIADCAPVMMWLTGPEPDCTYFNKLWLAFRGRNLEQEIGKGWIEGIHPQDAARYVETYLEGFQARQKMQTEFRMQRADGEYRWISGSAVPRFGLDGAFEGYIGAAVDITDRKAQQPTGRMPLTEREKQVLVLIAEGKSTKEAAAMLGISYKTADSHRSKIMEKLDVHETASLVRYAIRQRLIEP